MRFASYGIAGFVATSLLSGCVTPIDPAVVESAGYQMGYTHGCTTATRQSNGFQSEIVEDKALMDSDNNYQAGWRQGFYGCGGSAMDPKGYNQGEWYQDIGD